ncbi:MAG: hypothetical protein HYT03_02615 [Candidatus Harrisonbacteria bacterium]|nr:hypothetical protein [Candidatus Harrisonbacteria bacterium]
MELSYKLPVTILKEKSRYVAYSPAIDLSTSGKTFDEAQKRFAEASLLFFEEIIKEKTSDEVLSSLGWNKVHRNWKPPVVVSQQSATVTVPAR